jgi:hypothetical protein
VRQALHWRTQRQRVRGGGIANINQWCGLTKVSGQLDFRPLTAALDGVTIVLTDSAWHEKVEGR